MTTIQETQQIKTLIRQIAEAKANEYVQEMLANLMGLGNGTTTPRKTTIRRARSTTTKTTTKAPKTSTTEGANRILKFIQAKPDGILGMELKPAVGLTDSVYHRALKALKKEGKIKQKGERRRAAYFAK